ncbi:hypothetical protein NEFER03_0777 [Nematocida sp. LUAm3]|nr:hypothetical protein NEFER03_0777 [Nematocida sp. LUAm3]KAI5175236.1 hypothetical protein NEFER02_1197 [Nematocida sp. LUAm2]KAI5178092.1 hypothetical protein NEFER01_1270 [Nematocida sp. LUAm1]
MQKIYFISIFLLKNVLTSAQEEPDPTQLQTQPNPLTATSIIPFSKDISLNDYKSFQKEKTEHSTIQEPASSLPPTSQETAKPSALPQKSETARASIIPGIVDGFAEYIPKSIYSLDNKGADPREDPEKKKNNPSLYNLEVGFKRLFKKDSDPKDPGIIPEKYKKEVFFLFFFIGYAMCVSGEHYKSFFLSTIIFIYLFSYIVFLFRSETNIVFISYFDILNIFPKIKSSVLGQIVLSCCISVVFSYIFIWAIHLFFTLTITLSFLWFILYGPGYKVISLYSTARLLFFTLVIVFIGFFFVLRATQKRIEILLLRTLFGFFGSVLLFFSGAEIFNVPMILPGILLNYHSKPLNNILSEGLALIFTTGISVYLQAQNTFKFKE